MNQRAPGSLEHWAENRPAATAIVEGECSLSYAAWNEAADRVARGLAARGLGAGDVVVVRTHIRLEWAIVASALAKLGCSLLGLNWRLTPSEAAYVLSNSAAAALVCDDPEPGPLGEALRGLPLKATLSIDAEADGWTPYAALLEEPAEPRFSRGDPPLIVYTSGTTGLPKGVVMGRRSPHYTEAELLEYLRDVGGSSAPPRADDVVLVTMPMHHGSGPAQVWGALRRGRKIVLLRRFDPERSLALIARHKVTHWATVPTMLKRIAALPGETLARYDVGSMRVLSAGAAPVPFALKQWAVSHFGRHCLSEGYGATEVGMIARLTPEAQLAKPGSSGKPYKHVHVEVRDPDGRVLPPRAVGELWVRTPTTLARYLHGSELGADTLDERGFFRVGDIGYLDDEGDLYITDRAKDMIISGGVNIYPAEIEAALARHPGVLDSAVIGIPDAEFGEQVKAFVELRPGRSVTTEELAQVATEHLASYKRPKSYEIVAELPRNTMGKVLKGELRAPYWKGQERQV